MDFSARKVRRKAAKLAHDRADALKFADSIYAQRMPDEDCDEDDEMDQFDDIENLEKVLEFRGLEAHPTHTPAERAAMGHDEQNWRFSEVRPCKTKAEAQMLWLRWLKEIGPEVYQFWRSFGWRVPKWLKLGKVLKLQDKKIRVSLPVPCLDHKDELTLINSLIP